MSKFRSEVPQHQERNREMRDLCAKGASQILLAGKYGLSKQRVSQIVGPNRRYGIKTGDRDV